MTGMQKNHFLPHLLRLLLLGVALALIPGALSFVAPLSCRHNQQLLLLVQRTSPFSPSSSGIACAYAPQQTRLFVSTTPDDDEGPENSNSPEKEKDNSNSDNSAFVIGNYSLVDLGIKGALALLGVALLLQGMFSMMNMLGNMASSAVGALGQELAREFLNLVVFLGSILLAVAGFAWEGVAKVLFPALGQAAVAGYNAAAPVVGQAASSAVDTATPYVQEAASQFNQAAAPYVDSATSAVDSTLHQATDSLSSAVDQTLVSPLRDATESVMTPWKEATDSAVKETTDSISTSVKSIMEQVPRAF